MPIIQNMIIIRMWEDDRRGLRRRFFLCGGPCANTNSKVLRCPHTPRSDGQSPILAFLVVGVYAVL